MTQRPLSVSIIARVLIFFGVLSLVTTLATFVAMTFFGHREMLAALERNPLPIPVQYAMGITGLSVMVIAGVAMLRGRHWGRVLYIAWTLFGTLVGVLTTPQKLTLIPGFVLFLIMVFFLFRPAANAFFRAVQEETRAAEDTPTVNT